MTPKSILALVFAILALVGPLVAQALSPSAVTLIVTICGIVGAIAAHVASALQPNASDAALRARVERAAHVADSTPTKALLGHLLGGATLLCLALVLVLSGCGWLSSHPTAVPVVETIACDVATALDPSQAVLICAGVDAAGNIVESFEPLTTSAASAQAFARRFPSVPAVHALVVARGAR
jgi:hypothetical protein